MRSLGRLVKSQVRASASLLRTGAVHALSRAGQRVSLGLARRLFDGMFLVRLDKALLDRPGEHNPLGLRSVDAIHLAAALAVWTRSSRVHTL